uniref:Variant surface glycoprotein 1125.4107 n=1 Tax=Trypanosoma brucei TaxID=5691 RepID=A0A1J0RA05_9TRYP|nr:variant surface glycoprotein 1125.4107 [Trypanosoma brucei]
MKPIIQLLLLLLHLLVNKAQGATKAAEAAIELKALCRLKKLLETPVVKSSPDPKVAKNVLEILSLNMSAGPEDWKANFGDGSDKHSWASIKGKYSSESYSTDWQKRWTDWLKAAAAIAPTATNKAWLAEHPKPAQPQIAAAQLKHLANEAKKMQADYESQYKTEVTDKEEYAAAKLKAALTGVHSDKGADFNAFASNNAAKRANGDCDGAKASQGVLYDMACLCIGAAPTTETDGCIGADLSKAWSANKGDLAAAMTELKSHCAQGFRATLTAETLTAAVAAVENLIGGRGTTTVVGDKLGKSNTADCTGAADKVCVRYEEYYSSTANAPKQQKVPWMAAIEEASTALTAAEKAKTQAVATAASIANLKTTAEAVYAAAQIKQEVTASESQGAPQSKHTIDCTNIKTNSTCKEKGCKWEEKDGKDGKCVVNESKVTQQTNKAARAGEAAKEEAASTGCARHFNDKNACKKMNKRKKKPVCAWKKRW